MIHVMTRCMTMHVVTNAIIWRPGITRLDIQAGSPVCDAWGFLY